MRHVMIWTVLALCFILALWIGQALAACRSITVYDEKGNMKICEECCTSAGYCTFTCR